MPDRHRPAGRPGRAAPQRVRVSGARGDRQRGPARRRPGPRPPVVRGRGPALPGDRRRSWIHRCGDPGRAARPRFRRGRPGAVAGPRAQRPAGRHRRGGRRDRHPGVPAGGHASRYARIGVRRSAWRAGQALASQVSAAAATAAASSTGTGMTGGSTGRWLALLSSSCAPNQPYATPRARPSRTPPPLRSPASALIIRRVCRGVCPTTRSRAISRCRSRSPWEIVVITPSAEVSAVMLIITLPASTMPSIWLTSPAEDAKYPWAVDRAVAEATASMVTTQTPAATARAARELRSAFCRIRRPAMSRSPPGRANLVSPRTSPLTTRSADPSSAAAANPAATRPGSTAYGVTTAAARASAPVPAAIPTQTRTQREGRRRPSSPVPASPPADRWPGSSATRSATTGPRASTGAYPRVTAQRTQARWTSRPAATAGRVPARSPSEAPGAWPLASRAFTIGRQARPLTTAASRDSGTACRMACRTSRRRSAAAGVPSSRRSAISRACPAATIPYALVVTTVLTTSAMIRKVTRSRVRTANAPGPTPPPVNTRSRRPSSRPVTTRMKVLLAAPRATHQAAVRRPSAFVPAGPAFAVLPWAGPAFAVLPLAGPALAGPALAGPALAGPALAEPALAEPALAEPALAGPAWAGPAAAAVTGHLPPRPRWRPGPRPRWSRRSRCRGRLSRRTARSPGRPAPPRPRRG